MQPQPPSGDDQRLQPLIAYLQQHRGQFNDEALRRQLVEAGHAPALVDEALRRVGPNASPRPPAWPIGVLIMLANLVAIPAMGLGLLWLATQSPSPVGAVLGWLSLGVGPVTLLAEALAGSWLARGPRERLGRALIWGVGLTVAATVALGVLAFGVCIALIAGLSAP